MAEVEHYSLLLFVLFLVCSHYSELFTTILTCEQADMFTKTCSLGKIHRKWNAFLRNELVFTLPIKQLSSFSCHKTKCF